MTIKVSRTGAADYGPWWNFLLSGRPGVGKTPFAVTAPNPLLLNVDAGLTSIADRGILVYPARDGDPDTPDRIENSDQLEEIVAFLGEGPEYVAEQFGTPVETIIVDTIDEVARILQNERKASKRRDEMQAGDWDWLATQLNVFTRALCAMDYNVIFISHIKDVHDGETGATSFKLDISGAGAHQIPQAPHVAMFMDDRSVALVEHRDADEETEYEKMSHVYTQKLDKFEWIKDRTETLPAVIECDFENGFVDIIDLINRRKAEMKEQEIITATFEAEAHIAAPSTPEPKAKAKTEAPSADDIAAKTAEADAKLAAAKEAALKRAAKDPKPAKETAEKPVPAKESPETPQEPSPGDVVPRATAVTVEDPARSADEATVDLETLDDGASVTVEQGLGFQFSKAGVPMQIMGARYVYEVEGAKVLSRVKLPDPAVRPIPSEAMDTGLFCQVTGVEITPEEANLSRLRVRKFLCTDEYTKEIAQAKQNMTRK